MLFYYPFNVYRVCGDVTSDTGDLCSSFLHQSSYGFASFVKPYKEATSLIICLLFVNFCPSLVLSFPGLWAYSALWLPFLRVETSLIGFRSFSISTESAAAQRLYYIVFSLSFGSKYLPISLVTSSLTYELSVSLSFNFL